MKQWLKTHIPLFLTTIIGFVFGLWAHGCESLVADISKREAQQVQIDTGVLERGRLSEQFDGLAADVTKIRLLVVAMAIKDSIDVSQILGAVDRPRLPLIVSWGEDDQR